MKYIQSIRWETGLAVAALIGYLTMAWGIGCLLAPPQYGMMQLTLINGVISLAIALLVWSTFKLIEPLRYRRNWQICKFIFIPLVWLLLLAAIDVGIHYVIQSDQSQLEEISA
jgi:hypothetical protein